MNLELLFGIALGILVSAPLLQYMMNIELEKQRRHLNDMFYAQTTWCTTPKLPEGAWDITTRYDRVKQVTKVSAKKTDGEFVVFEWEE